MILAHTGDWHVTSGPRLEDTSRVLQWIVADGRAAGVGLWLVGGDLAGTTVPHVPTTEEALVIADTLQAMAESAPVVVCYGNHDYPRALDLFGRLRAPHPILVVSTAQLLEISGVRVGVLPYPHKRWMLAGGAGGGVEAQNAAAADLVRGILASWRGQVDVLLAHVLVGGARVGGGEVLIGREVELAPADLDETGAAYAALSHVHRCQQMSDVGWYAGSPSTQNFGEQSDEKCYLLAEVSAGRPARVTRRPTPARRLLTVEAEWHDGEWRCELPASAADAEVRLRVTVREEDAATCPVEELARAIEKLGAVRVQCERRIVPREAVRSTAVVEARASAEKVTAYWDSLGEAGPDAETRRRCLDKLAELEAGGDEEGDTDEAAQGKGARAERRVSA